MRVEYLTDTPEVVANRILESLGRFKPFPGHPFVAIRPNPKPSHGAGNWFEITVEAATLAHAREIIQGQEQDRIFERTYGDGETVWIERSKDITT